MIRRNGRNLHQEYEEEEINPMDGIGNLSDAMLVLAVGMMLALVVNWRLDFKSASSVRELQNATSLSENEVQQVESDEALEEKGVVYEDPETGKLYIRVKENEKNK